MDAFVAEERQQGAEEYRRLDKADPSLISDLIKLLFSKMSVPSFIKQRSLTPL